MENCYEGRVIKKEVRRLRQERKKFIDRVGVESLDSTGKSGVRHGRSPSSFKRRGRPWR